MSVESVMSLIKEKNVKFIDLRLTDTHGKEQHLSIPTESFSEEIFEEGTMFDGSSIAGWRSIDNSDMVMMPDPETAMIDPFMQETTLLIRCDVYDPMTGQPYDKDPRSIARKAEKHLISTGIADTAYFGPELEFFVFDGVRWGNTMRSSFYEIRSSEGSWASDESFDQGPNFGHRPSIKGGYFPVPPMDSMSDLRSAMCHAMTDMGLVIEKHHHEVATAGQAEIGMKYGTLLKQADISQIYKYCVHNVAKVHGMTATFMPKPLMGDNGTGMHVHQSLFKKGKNLFAGEKYANLSQTALYYMGGIFKHAQALNAFTNPTTNSYRRLVPGYEAPVLLAYSARNRSASCRIPYGPRSSTRVEVRFPDPSANPYLAFTAMMLAGIDGIQNKIAPGDPLDVDLYGLSPEEEAKIPHVAQNLGNALRSLDQDREFLTASGVFTDSVIDSFIELKAEEFDRLRLAVHPLEFEMYYSV